MIKDTCCCGAEFEVRSHTIDEAWRHKAWLDAHEVCRATPKSVQDFVKAPDDVREEHGEPVAKAAFKRQEESK